MMRNLDPSTSMNLSCCSDAICDWEPALGTANANMIAKA